jgi:Kef-type K+ transport system membrane component KefB
MSETFLQFIFALAVIITAAKLGGYISYKLGQPAVVGEVIMGLALGPSLINFLKWPMFTYHEIGETISLMSELGVLLLMFIAGLELHLDDLVKSGKFSVFAGFLGFLAPLVMGFFMAQLYAFDLRQSLYIGLLLAPTSVSISAQALMELNALRTRTGVGLLGAAVIDDMLVVLGLSVFTAVVLGGGDGSIGEIGLMVLEMILFLAAAIALGVWLLPKVSKVIAKIEVSQGVVAFAFILMLLFAWTAESFGHMATIIGSFMAGIFFSQTTLKRKLESSFSAVAYGIFVPIFFINIGLSADIRQIAAGDLWLLAGFILVAVLSKIIGAGIGGTLGGLSLPESMRLGFGLVPRGEVVLIVATIGILENIIESSLMPIVVIMVIFTTIITPPILRLLLSKSKDSKIQKGV